MANVKVSEISSGIALATKCKQALFSARVGMKMPSGFGGKKAQEIGECISEVYSVIDSVAGTLDHLTSRLEQLRTIVENYENS